MRVLSSKIALFAAAFVLASFASGCDALPFRSDGASSTVVIPEADDSALPDSVRARYRDDAGRLALRRAREEETSQQVRLPGPLVETLYNALVRVYLAKDLEGRDAVAGALAIHTFPSVSVRTVSVTPEENRAAWIEAWKDGRRFTENGAVNELLRAYDLDLLDYNVYSFFESARLRAEAPLNTLALSDLFEQIGGVKYADPEGYAGDGADIEATLADDAVTLRYSVGYGDCPSGCINRHYWTFRVTENGRVTFEGESGDALPAETRRRLATPVRR